MAKKITTLFLRDSAIQIAVMNGQRIEKWASGSLDEGLVNQGLVADETKAASAVRDLMRLNKIPGGKAIVGVSGVNSLYRMITLPEMPEALLAEAVRREAKRVLPVNLDEVYLSYQEVTAVSKGEKRLFLATYPKNITDAMVKTARLAGLSPYLMDLSPLALSRIPDEPRSIIVNARGSYAEIIVIEDRIPQLIRVLALPAEAATINETLPGVTEELNRTVIFYNSSHSEKPLNQSVPLFVCGDLAENQDLWPQLVGRLNFPVSTLPAGMEIPAGLPVNDYMVNIGLALKEFSAERTGTNFSTVNLNILPETYHPKRVPLSNVLVPVLAVIGVALLVYMATFVLRANSDTRKLREQAANSEPPIAAQTQKIASLKAEVTQLTPQVAPLEAEAAQIKATAAVFVSKMSALETNRLKVDTDMRDNVVGKLPFNVDYYDADGLGLLAANHDGNTITITGMAGSEDKVFEYARKLREAVGYSSILVTSISQADTGYAYNIIVR